MYDVNILVNGSRCKQYTHDGKIFVEAKKGSEYTIEIKNSTWQRILAVCSVDGLDVLNGKPALESNPGYVISAYNTLKIDGFRVSNEKVAKFLFDYKGASYAASKEDGSERNVGVIGVRLFQEKIKPAPVIVKEVHHHHDHYHDYWWNRPWTWPTTTPLPNPPIIWCDTLMRDSDPTYGTSCNTLGDTKENALNTSDWMGAECERSSQKYSCDNIPKRSASPQESADLVKRFQKLSGTKSATKGNPIRSMNLVGSVSETPDPRGFDMGTKWGEAKESRVVEVEFEKGILALTTNIYYASRQSLLEMGIPLGNEKQVSFPEPFDDKYAKPPKNWVG